jgi:hypothetical protein
VHYIQRRSVRERALIGREMGGVIEWSGDIRKEMGGGPEEASESEEEGDRKTILERI